MIARDALIGIGLVSVGIGTMVVIAMPMVSLGPTTFERGVIDQRWLPPLRKADPLPHVALVEPSVLDPALLGPRDGDIIEQVMERKLFDKDVETATKEYYREVREHRERQEYCERHGMHRRYFHRRHHLVWRCRR
jgi:hypothetical protein